MVRVVSSPGQENLDFTAAPDPAVIATSEDVQRLVGILERGGQLTAAEICIEMGLPVTENHKRKIRAIARAARPGIVSFPNSPGYKLAKHCTIEELWAWISSLNHQIEEWTATKKLAQDYYYSRGGK